MNNNDNSQIILYIEDDPASKKLLTSLINSYKSITVLTAWSAEKGIHLANHHKPQIIFLDINLPCMCGREAVQHLLANPDLHQTKIIALSADANPNNIESALRLGFHDYLTKPINISDIVSIINTTFSLNHV